MSVLTKAPKFWVQAHHPLSFILAPLGFLYGLGVQARFALTKPYRSTLPVICIGNFTVGGGGKTPLALEVADLLIKAGYKPVFLTRGYGGRIKGPHLVDAKNDSAADVGDEPLLLARTASVIVCADRAQGARFIERLDTDVIIMDDGFQNPTLYKNLSLLVVDQATGFGNGRIFPAGPLRAGLGFQMVKAGTLALVGKRGGSPEIEQRFRGAVFYLELKARGDVGWLRETRVSAVSGIANPGKFYASLEKLAARIVQKHEFPDHHMFCEKEAATILQAAARDELPIVMTQKDWVRLPQTGERGRLRDMARVLHVRMTIDQPRKLLSQLENAISFATQDID